MFSRGHALRLQRGDRSFLPESIVNKAPTDLMVASFKFAGYQVGYIVWGFIVTHLVLFLIACVFAFGLIWPLTWGTVEDSIILYLLLSLWPTLVISLLTVLAQKLMAKYIFLRDFGATLALNNRRLFHIVSYFLYFLNIFIGLFSCLIRIIYAMLVGVVFLPRLQKSALPRDWEIWDPGFNTYLGYLVLEHTHTNPVLCTFSQLVLDAIAQKERGGREVGSLKYIISRKARNRWLLTVTLINNPELRDLRKPEVYEKNVFLALKNTAVLGWKIGELDQYAETKF